MIIEWSDPATRDLENIADYWTDRNPQFGGKLVDELYRAGLSLHALPRRGRPGRIVGTREFSVPKRPYVIFYRVKKDRITIDPVIHTSRDWPNV